MKLSKMDKKAQVRWIIIAILLIIVAGMLYYPDVIKPYLSKLIELAKPITGYATGAADKAIHAIPQ